ncbi:MAG: hypothetical protein EBT45_00305 [Alphaproteobacteria bacterium]|jgi:hypothetical protein|nr:hypothetical protein [Alphaproteobacteria bacterium]
MHGSLFQNLYYNSFSGINQGNKIDFHPFGFGQEQGNENILEENEFSINKPSVFEFVGQNEMTVLSPKKRMAVGCAWPELLYRKLVLGFLGIVMFAFLVNAF